MDYCKEIHLDRKRPDQIYYQLAEALADMILSGRLPGRSVLPSIQKLSDEIGISRTTVRKAYSELLNRGLVLKKSPYRCQVGTLEKFAGKEPFPCIGIVMPCSFSRLVKMPDCAPSFSYISGIFDAAMENQLSTTMLELPDIHSSRQEIESYNDNLSKRLIGLIHIGDRLNYPDHPLEAVLKNRSLPQVFIAGIPKMENVGAVLCDDMYAAKMRAQEFQKMNHRHIGFLLESDDFSQTQEGRYFFYAGALRDKTARSVFEKFGLDCDDRFHCASCRSYDSIFRKLKQKAESGDMPTVYWCHNDIVAKRCIRALGKLGFEVPHDISVVGFDGLPGSEEISTFNMPFYSMGRKSVAALLDYHRNGLHAKNRFFYLKPVMVNGKTLSFAKNEPCK